MSLNTVKMLGISVTTNPKKEILEEIQKFLVHGASSTKKNFVIVTPNPEQLVLAQKNSHFFDVLNRADVAIPDGIGLVWALRLFYPKLSIQRIPGVEFMEELVKMASNEGFPIRLIGGNSDLAVKTFDCLKKIHPGLLTSPHPKIIFVGLGAPKQEFYIDEEAKKTTGVVYMAVGGSFDIISGRLPRAPIAVRSFGLEWLWRLILEPWRFRRQLALVRFCWLVFKERLHI